MKRITLKPSTHLLGFLSLTLVAVLSLTACSPPSTDGLSDQTEDAQDSGSELDDTQASDGESAQDEASEITENIATENYQDAPLEEAVFVEGPTGLAAEFEPEQRNDLYDARPPMILKPDLYYYATIVTERGDINVQLFPDRAPATVNNFVYLARDGFYDNTTFHRVLDGFMAQTGDPTGSGAGGPGYEFEDEFYPGLVFDRPGLLAMANAGPNTNGSQFFITYGPTPHLSERHAIFGEVTEGFDVLSQLTRRDPNQRPDYSGDLVYTITIQEWDLSYLPTPTVSPPTPTPLPTPTAFSPSSLDAEGRPLADVPLNERANYFNRPPDPGLDASQQYIATFTTAKGNLVAELYAEKAPVAVNNFITLVKLPLSALLIIIQLTMLAIVSKLRQV